MDELDEKSMEGEKDVPAEAGEDAAADAAAGPAADPNDGRPVPPRADDVARPHGHLKVTRRQAVLGGAGVLAAAIAGAVGISRYMHKAQSVATEPSSSEADSSKLGGKLTMYTCCSDSLVNAFVSAFQQQTGVAVDVRLMDAASMIELVDAEGSSGAPIADVVWGADASWYTAVHDKLGRYISSQADGTMSELRDSEGYVTPVTREATAIVVNRQIAQNLDLEITGYASLLNSKLAGRVALADPARDADAFLQLVGVLGGKDKWALAQRLFEQAAGVVRQSADDVIDAVLDGSAVCGLLGEQRARALMASTDEVDVVIPAEGTVVLASNTAILNGCSNLAQAQAWVDYACGHDGQQAAADKTYLRPVREDVNLHSDMPAESGLDVVEVGQAEVTAGREELLATWASVVDGTWTSVSAEDDAATGDDAGADGAPASDAAAASEEEAPQSDAE